MTSLPDRCILRRTKEKKGKTMKRISFMCHEASRPRNQRPQGFTLIELLVVIGIIMILLRILLPTVSAAKQYSYTVACTSNLRQLIMAWKMYVNEDSLGRSPMRHDGPGPTAAQTWWVTYLANCPSNPPCKDPDLTRNCTGYYMCPQLGAF